MSMLKEIWSCGLTYKDQPVKPGSPLERTLCLYAKNQDKLKAMLNAEETEQYLNHKKTVNYLSPLLLSAMKSELRSSVKFLGEMIFKLAVEHAVSSNLFAAQFDFDPEDVKRLRKSCADTVGGINGILTAEDAHEWQRGK